MDPIFHVGELVHMHYPASGTNRSAMPSKLVVLVKQEHQGLLWHGLFPTGVVYPISPTNLRKLN